jgi:hypothetical protein
MTTRILALTLGLAALAAAQSVPAGWKIATDRRKLCQIAVPADWVADKIMPSQLTSPDKKAKVLVHGIPAPGTFASTVETAKKMFAPTKVFEESATKAWWASEPSNHKPGASWYVATGGASVCDAQVEFEGAAFDEVAKKIVASLGPAK